MRSALLYFLRFTIGAVLAWLLGYVLIRTTGERWHRLGGRNPVDPVHSYQHYADPVDIVFFGTSSTRNAIVPELLEQELERIMGQEVSIWNLGLPNATPEIGRILAEDFFQKNKPRYLVLEAAPFLWDGDRGGDADFSVYWRWFSSPSSLMSRDRPLRRQDVIPFLRNLDRDWEDIWASCQWIRIEDLRAEELYLPPQGGLYRMSDLTLPRRGDPVDQTKPNRESRRVSHYSTPQIWRDELDHILTSCKENDIQVILMHQPMYERLLPIFEVGTYEAFLAWMTTVAQANDLPLLLLQDQIPMEVKHFRDYIHYSPQGAAHFTREVAPLLAPLLRADDE
jgi:hypothetical protein